MSHKFTKQNLRIKWITTFYLIYLMLLMLHAITLTHLLFFQYSYDICYYLLTQLFRELPKIISLIIYSTHEDRVYCEYICTFSLLSCSVNLAFSCFKNASSFRRISFCNFSVVAMPAIYTYVALCYQL